MLITGEWERLTEQQAEEIATLRALCSEREHERDAAQSRAEELEGQLKEIGDSVGRWDRFAARLALDRLTLKQQLAASQEREKNLLEALKLAREVIDEECSCDMCVRLASTVNAAIAKAEGKQPACDCHKHDRQVCDVCQSVAGREGKDQG